MTDPRRAHDPESGVTAPCPCHTGTTTERDWHRGAGPGQMLAERHGLDSRHGYVAAWVGHPYRLRLPDGRWCYVAEPYALDADALADLAFLAGHGYVVTVTAWQARHNPGHTLAVHITREAP